jgi:hypothetical protein
MLMNNRFVVPAGMADNVTKFATLQAALTAPGIHAGDMIQIEPNSSPGQLNNNDIPQVMNLTVQGDPAFDVRSIPLFTTDSPVFIGSAQQGFTLKNVEVDIQNGTLQFTADSTITGCMIANDFAGTAISLQGTSGAVISNCYIVNSQFQDQQALLLDVQPASGSHNRITDNQFLALQGTNVTLLEYQGGADITDVVAHNNFVDDTGDFGTLVDVQGNTQGLTIQGNTFASITVDEAITVGQVQNLQIMDNSISLPAGPSGILVDPVQANPSSIVIADNRISTGGQGIGIAFQGGLSGVDYVAKVEGNDLHGNIWGVSIGANSAGSMAGIDLGGGSQGSRGANNFRGDPTAIYIFASASQGPISAHMNIFGVADPSTVIHDHHVDSTLASVVSSSHLTGNAAFIETLYLDFLHRTGDLSNPKDAGIWVTRMNQGMPAATVANLVARSAEALGDAIDGLYHRFLGRDADAAGRANFVAYLQAGGTLEGVSQMLLASPEYHSHFPTDTSFVQSLYENLLQRSGSHAEVNGWVAQLPQLGRAGVAQGFLLSQEYRADEVGEDYTWYLHRTGSSADINSWVNSGKDLVTIDALFAGSVEFQQNG